MAVTHWASCKSKNQHLFQSRQEFRLWWEGNKLLEAFLQTGLSWPWRMQEQKWSGQQRGSTGNKLWNLSEKNKNPLMFPWQRSTSTIWSKAQMQQTQHNRCGRKGTSHWPSAGIKAEVENCPGDVLPPSFSFFCVCHLLSFFCPNC